MAKKQLSKTTSHIQLLDRHNINAQRRESLVRRITRNDEIIKFRGNEAKKVGLIRHQ